MKDILFRGLTLKETFDAEVTAALMIQSNALIPIKLVVRLCGISRQEIDRRVNRGSFPKPTKLSSRKKAMRKAFYLKDIHDWIKNPHAYRQAEE